MKNKIKTIFELLNKEADEETHITFDAHLYNRGWENSSLDSNVYDNVVLISQGFAYNIYLAWDDGDNIDDTALYRKKRESPVPKRKALFFHQIL